jgi:hypothetical protein
MDSSTVYGISIQDYSQSLYGILPLNQSQSRSGKLLVYGPQSNSRLFVPRKYPTVVFFSILSFMG